MNMKIVLFFVFMVIGTIMAENSNETCYSCGPECASACGVKDRFRSCCNNYLKKRSVELLDQDEHNAYLMDQDEQDAHLMGQDEQHAHLMDQDEQDAHLMGQDEQH